MSAGIDKIRSEYADRRRRLAPSDRYSLLNMAHLFTVQQRQRQVVKLIRRYQLNPLAGRRILEVGCGQGGIQLAYLGFGADPERLHGVDLLFHRVGEAHARLPHLPHTCADGQLLPYASGAFDLILQYTVFSSILDDVIRIRIAREMQRVLNSNGSIIWYDFWLNPTNRRTRGIRPREVRALFPNSAFKFHRVTLAPPITRRIVRWSWGVCLLMEKLQLFNTHYLVAIQPQSG